MEISSIAGAAALMQTAQTQQGISTGLLKNAAEQQNQLANMLAKNAKNAKTSQQTSGDYGFSTVA